MKTQESPFVLVTGASAGIGKSIAVEFAKRNFNLVLTARRSERLEQLKHEIEQTYKVKVHTISADLSRREDIESLFSSIAAQGVVLTHLINNAGLGFEGSFQTQSISSSRSIIDVNISALTDLTHYFLAQIDESEQTETAGILQVASTAAFYPGPYMAVYYASKAYVKSFSQAVDFELSEQKSRCYCSVLYPGPVFTEFQERAGIAESNLFKGKLIKPESAQNVARYTVTNYLKKKRTIIPGFMNKLSYALHGIMPRTVSNQLVKFLHN